MWGAYASAIGCNKRAANFFLTWNQPTLPFDLEIGEIVKYARPVDLSCLLFDGEPLSFADRDPKGQSQLAFPLRFTP
jgi:hypothetical protein